MQFADDSNSFLFELSFLCTFLGLPKYCFVLWFFVIATLHPSTFDTLFCFGIIPHCCIIKPFFSLTDLAICEFDLHINMVVVKNASFLMGVDPERASTPPPKEDTEPVNPESPTKKRRTTYEQKGKFVPKGLLTREEYILDTKPDLSKGFGAMSFWQSKPPKQFIHEEIPLDTKFERRDHWMTGLGYMGKDFINVGETDEMGPLAMRQKYYRVEPQHRIAKERARVLLHQTWKTIVDGMVQVFKDAMRCKNCEKHHLPDGLANVVGVLDEILRTKDPNDVDQAWLEDFREVACQSAEELLAEMMEKDPACRGTRKVYTRKPNDTRGRADSGVSMTAGFEEKLKPGFKSSEQEIVEGEPLEMQAK
jgi:hypothetical protein